MPRIYSRRRTVGWYTDELGRRRPITRKELVIDLVDVVRAYHGYREKIRRKWENTSVTLSIDITIDNMDLNTFLETFPDFKITRLHDREAIEIYDGVIMHFDEFYDEETRKKTLILSIHGLLTDKAIAHLPRLFEAIRKLLSNLPMWPSKKNPQRGD